MAKYTIELRWLIENGFSLPLENYPIFDESYRSILNNAIIQHFYFREIGLETPALFANRLKEKMNLVMPFYNKLFLSVQEEFNPLLTTNLKDSYTRSLTSSKTHSGKSSGTGQVTGDSGSSTTSSSQSSSTSQTTGEQSSTSQTKAKKISSDTPQGLLLAQSIDDNTWATTAGLEQADSTVSDTSKSDSEITGSVNDSSTTSGKNSQSSVSSTADSYTDGENATETTTHNIVGYQGKSAQELIMLYRESLINVQQMLFDDLEELFMVIF